MTEPGAAVPLVAAIETIIAIVPDINPPLEALTRLGFSEVWRDGGGDEHVSCAVSLGDCDLELMAPRDSNGPSYFAGLLRDRPGLTMLSLGTPDIDATVSGFRDRGLRVQDPTFRQGARRKFRFVMAGRSVTPGIRAMITQYEDPSPRTRGSDPMKIKKLDHVPALVELVGKQEPALHLTKERVLQVPLDHRRMPKRPIVPVWRPL